MGVALIPTLPDAVNTLSSLSRVVRSGVNGSMTLVEGAGVKGFDISPPIGPPVDNTFTVTARDSEGNPVLDVEPEDLTVELSAKGGTQAGETDFTDSHNCQLYRLFHS